MALMDRYESNDSLAAATKISGTTGSLAATIHSATDEDWYQFTLDGTGSSASELGFSYRYGAQRIDLYNASGTKLRTIVNSISLSGYAKGVYYAKVYDTDKQASGDYTISWNTSYINTDPYESNDTFAAATKISGASGSLNANIHSATDQDWYQITLEGTGSPDSKIALTASTGGQRIEIYNASGARFRNAASSISLAGVPKGTFYVKVFDVDKRPSGDYTLTWNSSSLQADKYEANDSLAKATTISGINGSLAASIHSAADQDWYKVTLDGTGTSASKIAFSKSTGGQRIELYTAAGKKFRNATESISLANAPQGVYYARVYDTAKKASGDYNLIWDTSAIKADKYESNDSLAKAARISGTSGSLAATIHSAADQDWYKFTLDGTGTSASKIAFSKSTDAQRIELYTASGKKFRNAATSLSLANAPQGVYYARVYDTAKNASGDYTLIWDTSAIKADKYESNDSLAKAARISGTSGSLAATIHTTSDQDWYKVTLEGTGTSASKIAFGKSAANQRIELYTAAGKKFRNAATSLSLVNAPQGVYYARVYDTAKKASGDYTLIWDTSAIKADRYESNDSLAKAARISGTSGSLAATIHNASDQDWYKFTLDGPGASASKIAFSNSTGGQRIELYNASGKKFRNAATSISLAGVPKGTYYAKVYDTAKKASGDYTLSWNVEAASASSRARAAGVPIYKISTSQASVMGDNNIIYYPGTYEKGTVSLYGNNNVMVYNGQNLPKTGILNSGKGKLTLLFSGVDSSSIAISEPAATIEIAQKSDPYHNIVISNWDSSRDSIIFGGSLPNFNKYINSASPTTAQTQAAWNEINNATHGVLAS